MNEDPEANLLHGECKSICSTGNELESGEYVGMVGQGILIKADPRNTDEEWNLGVNEAIN